MTTLRSIHLATRASCAGRVVPAGAAGLERPYGHAGQLPAGTCWLVRGGNQAEGFGLVSSKDLTREVLPT